MKFLESKKFQFVMFDPLIQLCGLKEGYRQILNNLQIFPEDRIFSGTLLSRFNLALCAPLASMLVLRYSKPNLGSTRVGRFLTVGSIHVGFFGIACGGLVYPKYVSSVAHLNSPVGKLLSTSGEKFPSDQHMLQKYFVDLSRRQALQKENAESGSVIMPQFDKFVCSLILVNRFLQHQEYCELRNSLQGTFVEINDDNCIKSQDDLNHRLDKIPVFDNEIDVMTKTYTLFLSSFAFYILLLFCSPRFLKPLLKESMLLWGLFVAVLVSRKGLHEWMYLDTPRASMIRSHKLGEKSPHVLLVQAEQRMKEFPFEFSSDEVLKTDRPSYQKAIETMVKSDCFSMLNDLNRNEYSSPSA